MGLKTDSVKSRKPSEASSRKSMWGSRAGGMEMQRAKKTNGRIETTRGKEIRKEGNTIWAGKECREYLDACEHQKEEHFPEAILEKEVTGTQ